MRLEKLPEILGRTGIKEKVYNYLMALFLSSGLNEARQIADALKDILASIENAIYREEERLK